MKAILTYHSIDETGSPISMPSSSFEAHRRWLTSGAVRPQSLDDLLAHAGGGEDAVAVTFDDGFANTKAPIERLLDAGITPTLVVVPGHVGGTNDWGGRDQPGIPRLPLLTWDDLGYLSGRGLRIEAHSRTHPHLTRLSPAQLDDELGGCCEDLDRHLGIRSAHLAYPYGDVNSAVATQAAKWFSHAVTTELAPLAPASTPMMLPRLDMYYYRAPGTIEAWGSSMFGVRLKVLALRRRLKAALLPPGRAAER